MLEPIDYWLFHDEFTVVQAALLIIGVDPSNAQEWVLQNQPDYRPEGFDAVFSAITKAINSKKLKATIRYDATHQSNFGWVQQPDANEVIQVLARFDLAGELYEIDTATVIYVNLPDWTITTIEVDDLKAWLLSRNFKPSFFFSETTGEPDYLNKEHLRYSAQLAAAVKVWIAFEDDNLLGAKTPKTAMEDWLTTNYAELGLVHQEKISKEAIKECAKVANWKIGGPATTPIS